jgi:succinyl-diaminopimelate desuccinylase
MKKPGQKHLSMNYYVILNNPQGANIMSKVLELTQQLIACPSVTPDDAGCQGILIDRLQAVGFEITPLPFADTTNLWARHGKNAPLLVLVGHTDVVPPGPLPRWTSEPFKPEIRDGYLYGRGATDMKSGLAAMICAAEAFVTAHPNHRGSIAFLITSDEEGHSLNGTVKVVDYLMKNGETIDWCLVGEASSEEQLGDTIKVGRRGSLGGILTIYGKQGHIAYPQLADNPIHRALPALVELSTTPWDQGNEVFQPTSFQISNFQAGTGANNVIPGELKLLFNFRFSPVVTAEDLQQKVEMILQRHQLKYELNWRVSAQPFFTPQGALLKATREAVQEITGVAAHLSTVGGTSDGRFIAPTGAQVVEFGPCNRTAHQINEHIKVGDLEKLVQVYQRILELLFIE